MGLMLPERLLMGTESDGIDAPRETFLLLLFCIEFFQLLSVVLLMFFLLSAQIKAPEHKPLTDTNQPAPVQFSGHQPMTAVCLFVAEFYCRLWPVFMTESYPYNTRLAWLYDGCFREVRHVLWKQPTTR